MTHRHVTQDELEVELTPLPDAIRIVLDSVTRLTAHDVALADADGLILADSVYATEDIPRWDNSSMDGYAVVAADTLNAPMVIDAEKIMTGRPLPTGTDSVVPWEETNIVDSEVRIDKPVPVGQFVRRAGEDVKAGALVMETGTQLTPAHLGLLASLGHTSVSVIARTRVAVVCTGDEVVAPGDERSGIEIYDANGTMLRALLTRAGAEVVEVHYAADDEESISKALAAATAQADVVVTTGGASVGEFDWTRTVLERDGELVLWRVSLRPGKPFALGFIQSTPVLVLPGNPASVLACAHTFAVPVIRKLMGLPSMHRQAAAQLTHELEAYGTRMFVCPVRYVDGQATPMRLASSSVLSNQLEANAFVTLAPGHHSAGEPVTVEFSS